MRIHNTIFYEHGELVLSEELCILAQKRSCKLIVAYSNFNQAKLGYFVGAQWIEEGKHYLQVRPKLDKPDSTGTAKETDILSMLWQAFSNPEVANHTKGLFEVHFDQPYIEMEAKEDLLTPFLVAQFLSLTRRIVQKGLKKSYYTVERKMRNRVKGKILVGQTVKHQLLRNTSTDTYCRFEEFGVNSVENRLLKKTLRFIRRYAPFYPSCGQAIFQNTLAYIEAGFTEVSEEVSFHEIQHYKANPFFKEYSEAINLAELILKRFGYSLQTTDSTGTIHTPPYWIDMSKLFELYVYQKLLEAFPGKISFQYQAHYGNPDFLYIEGEEKWIIDAKYKTYYNRDIYGAEQGVRNSVAEDIRQLSGYARDIKVQRALGIKDGDEIPCLIVFPDDKSTNEKFEFESKNQIPQFSSFWKLGIKVPVV